MDVQGFRQEICPRHDAAAFQVFFCLFVDQILFVDLLPLSSSLLPSV